eukprot:CAMPEP_0179054896 /NCGR_PEP_ID=MMETSP0796-20121207/23023_1 /TAXON_ID=73915 /ORGANISM="Pyrodinium bahamense, Strain pbaha01" /LENGTH=137 /DNA_ID=CAMNT_0020751535 /DNA_START=52 /DNA_END=465 /DNA_ORIENTATION=+
MARARSSLASLIVALAAAGLVGCLLNGLGPSRQWPSAYVPAPLLAAQAEERLAAQRADVGRALYVATFGAAAVQPAPALALEEDEEGFDVRILAVLALPLLAVSWALFNVWRVAFRQVVRIGESKSGSSKLGLAAED